MIYYTKYAEQKFEILNKHKVYFTREQVEDCIKSQEKINKRGKNLTVEKDGVKVVYKKEKEIIKIITFYPTIN